LGIWRYEILPLQEENREKKEREGLKIGEEKFWPQNAWGYLGDKPFFFPWDAARAGLAKLEKISKAGLVKDVGMGDYWWRSWRLILGSIHYGREAPLGRFPMYF
jgi:hypothetical protein